jgi:hypothetical protein
MFLAKSGGIGIGYRNSDAYGNSEDGGRQKDEAVPGFGDSHGGRIALVSLPTSKTMDGRKATPKPPKAIIKPPQSHLLGNQ